MWRWQTRQIAIVTNRPTAVALQFETRRQWHISANEVIKNYHLKMKTAYLAVDFTTGAIKEEWLDTKCSYMRKLAFKNWNFFLVEKCPGLAPQKGQKAQKRKRDKEGRERNEPPRAKDQYRY